MVNRRRGNRRRRTRRGRINRTEARIASAEVQNISRVERLATFPPGGAAGNETVVNQIEINARMSNFIVDIAQHYEYYQFKFLKFFYVPFGNSSGQVVMNFVMQSPSAVPTDIDQIAQGEVYTICSASNAVNNGINAARAWSPRRAINSITIPPRFHFTRWYHNDPNQDNTSNFGVLNFGVNQVPPGVLVGDLYVSYHLQLR